MAASCGFVGLWGRGCTGLVDGVGRRLVVELEVGRGCGEIDERDELSLMGDVALSEGRLSRDEFCICVVAGRVEGGRAGCCSKSSGGAGFICMSVMVLN